VHQPLEAALLGETHSERGAAARRQRADGLVRVGFRVRFRARARVRVRVWVRIRDGDRVGVDTSSRASAPAEVA